MSTTLTITEKVVTASRSENVTEVSIVNNVISVEVTQPIPIQISAAQLGIQGIQGSPGMDGLDGQDITPLYVQTSAPVNPVTPYQWWETNLDGSLKTLWVGT